VIAIIALLASLLLPALASAKENARLTMCRSNLHQLSLGTLMYASDHNDFLPWPTSIMQGAAEWCLIDLSGSATAPLAIHAEAGSIFPYVLRQSRIVLPGLTAHSRRPDSSFTVRFGVYACPGANDRAKKIRVNYSLNSFLAGSPKNRGIRDSSLVDPATKIILTDKTYEVALWYNTGSSAWQGVIQNVINTNEPRHRTMHNLAFADGHVAGIRRRAAIEIENNPELLKQYVFPSGQLP
jgi:prepilin-type processing-associated H-X9-DG protein